MIALNRKTDPSGDEAPKNPGPFQTDQTDEWTEAGREAVHAALNARAAGEEPNPSDTGRWAPDVGHFAKLDAWAENASEAPADIPRKPETPEHRFTRFLREIREKTRELANWAAFQNAVTNRVRDFFSRDPIGKTLSGEKVRELLQTAAEDIEAIAMAAHPELKTERAYLIQWVKDTIIRFAPRPAPPPRAPVPKKPATDSPTGERKERSFWDRLKGR